MLINDFLEKNTLHHWSDKYVEYNELSTLLDKLKLRFSKDLEKEFLDKLEENYNKCNDFYLKIINQIVDKLAMDTTQAEYLLLEVNDIYNYSIINRIAFYKICKTHDLISDIDISKFYSIKLDYLHFCPTQKVYKLISDISIIKRNNRNNYLQDKSINNKYSYLITNVTKNNLESLINNCDTQVNDFDRHTDKYWVKNLNLTKIMNKIMKNIPMYFFNDNNLVTEINSVYLDNDDHFCYSNRLNKLESAKSIRIRWYGDIEKVNYVFIEMKEHHEDWNLEVSSKNRFPISKKYVTDFIKHDELFKVDKELENFDLVKKVKKVIIDNKLVPKIMTKYIRFSFQDQDNDFIRISIDTNIRMIKKSEKFESWSEADEFLNSDKIHIFPYNLMEVKLRKEFIENKPEWLNQLILNDEITEANEFSKYCHGVATLCHKEIKIMPNWIFNNYDLFIREENNENLNNISRMLDITDNEKVLPRVVLDPKVILGLERNLLAILRTVFLLYKFSSTFFSTQQFFFQIINIFILFTGIYAYINRMNSLKKGDSENFSDMYYLNIITWILFSIIILYDFLICIF